MQRWACIAFWHGIHINRVYIYVHFQNRKFNMLMCVHEQAYACISNTIYSWIPKYLNKQCTSLFNS
jgi:hypothetical protein